MPAIAGSFTIFEWHTFCELGIQKSLKTIQKPLSPTGLQALPSRRRQIRRRGRTSEVLSLGLI